MECPEAWSLSSQILLLPSLHRTVLFKRGGMYALWSTQKTTLEPFILSVVEPRAPVSRGWFDALPKEPDLILHWLLCCPLEAASGLPQSVGSPLTTSRGSPRMKRVEVSKSRQNSALPHFSFWISQFLLSNVAHSYLDSLNEQTCMIT